MGNDKTKVALREAASEWAAHLHDTPVGADDRSFKKLENKLMRAAGKLQLPKRQYSRGFTPKTERRVMLTIDRIPPTLYKAVKAKARREGISLRALVLGWLKDWAHGSEQEGPT
jgi:predicted HicB family RNase H-like nuclease